MAENKPKHSVPYSLRIKAPIAFRVGAVLAIFVVIGVVVAGFLRERGKASFKLKSEHTRLSEDVLSEVDGYERLETEDGNALYLIRADHAKTFTDNHLELTGVYVELYREGGAADTMRSSTAIYIPEENKNFTTYLKGDVDIRTADALNVKTDAIVYARATETAEIESAVTFERGTVRGRSVGAVAKLAAKHLSLLRDVDIETFESSELAKSNVRYARLRAGSAEFDQVAARIDLNSGVTIDVQSTGRSSTATGGRSVVLFHPGEAGNNRLKSFELFDNAKINSAEGSVAIALDATYAVYDKDADRFELKNAVKIKSASDGREFNASSAKAIFEQAAHKLALTGSAEVTLRGDFLRGESIFANLFADNDIKDVVVRGNALLRRTVEGRTFDLSAPELNATFNHERVMQDANAVGQSKVDFLPSTDSGYTNVTGDAARGIGLAFRGDGALERMIADGRTTIFLNVQPAAGAANKRVAADSVKAFFAANGKDIQRAEAVGNAEMSIDPLAPDRKNYKTTITATRFDCAFFPTGNNARECEASPQSKAVRIPTVPVSGRGTQTVSGGLLTARFGAQSSDIETLELRSGARFNELDRNASADTIVYAASDDVIKLRGGEPVVWDSRGRAKGREIDLDMRNNRSLLRGGASTTYYSQKQINGSTPFSSSERPVFITAVSADFDHEAQTAVYSGNARGWQDDNYVRGDKISINQAAGTFYAEGNVQSLIFSAKRREKGKEGSVPASASAGSLAYERDSRILRYKTAVDIRQGTDRITAGSADIYLAENNTVSRTVAQNNVVISQPTRRAAGDWAQYSAVDEVATLKGSPATVTDGENGSSQAGQVTFSLRDNRVTTEGRTRQHGSTTRLRSVYKIKDLKP